MIELLVSGQASGIQIFDLFYRRQGKTCRATVSIVDSLKYQESSLLLSSEFYDVNTLDLSSLEFRSGRIAARLALIRLTGDQNPCHFPIERGTLHQPNVVSPVWPDVSVSLTHTAEFAAAIGFWRSDPMGIDLEKAFLSRAETLHRIFSLEELEMTDAVSGETLKSPAILWSVREAASKVLLGGINVNPRVLTVSQTRFVNGFYRMEFENFSHLSGIVWDLGEHILAIVLPSIVEDNILMQQVSPLKKVG